MASSKLTQGGLPNPQHVIISFGIFKIFDTLASSADVSFSRRPKRAAVPAPIEWPASTKRKPCQTFLLSSHHSGKMWIVTMRACQSSKGTKNLSLIDIQSYFDKYSIPAGTLEM